MFWGSNYSQISDPLFGTMKVNDLKKEAYFGNVHFAPLNKEIEISIYSTTGIIDEHRELYKQIEKRFSSYVNRFPALIENKFKDEGIDILILCFSNEFEITGMNMSYTESKQLYWSLEFNTILNNASS